MKKSITVLGIEAEGIRGVRLEESGTDWNCVDQEFWPIGRGGAADGADSSQSLPGTEKSLSVSDDENVSPDDRYAATVDALTAAAKHFGVNEVVLSVPLSNLLVKVVRTSVEDRESLQEAAKAELGKVSPFPDETPVTGIEIVSETDSELVTLFAALPEAVAADVGDALDEAKVRVLRTDVTALGWLRTLWPRIVSPRNDGMESGHSRTVVLLDLDDGWDVVVLDGGVPTLARGLGGVSDPAELGREITLSLLQAGMGIETGEIVVFSKRDVAETVVERLEQFAPVRIEKVEPTDADRGVDGVARRTLEGATLDVTPADWTELREEARFTRKLKMFLSAAVAGWVLVMGALYGGPMVYDYLTERQKAICKEHAKDYKAVRDMRDKVKLVQQYSDHARGTLEMLKAVSDRLPEGVTLTSFNYRRGEKLTLIGEADQPTVVYDFKNRLTDAEIVFEQPDGESDGEEAKERLFAEVTLIGPSKSRDVHRFTVECRFEGFEEEGQ